MDTCWQKPHISKIYEAITAVAEKRIVITDEHIAHCTSSSRGKFYTVKYDPETNSLMSNDNTAWYTDSLSYPMIALLMLEGVIEYNKKLGEILSGIVWKDINQKFKNNYDKAIEFVLIDLSAKGVDTVYLQQEVCNIYKKVCGMNFGKLGKKENPPVGY